MKLQEEAAPEPGTKIMFKKPTKRKEVSQDDSSISKRYVGLSRSFAHIQRFCDVQNNNGNFEVYSKMIT